MSFEKERSIAIECVLRACQATKATFDRLVGSQPENKERLTETKQDLSPVTVADYSAQAIVNSLLRHHFPQDGVVGEEDAAHLRSAEGAALAQLVVELTNSSLPSPLSKEEVLSAIDHGQHPGGSIGRHWALDPIDGTKGFLRGEQYAVCLALIEKGEVVLGVMGCPNLAVSNARPEGEKGCLFIAVKGQGAFQRTLDDPTETKISVSSNETPSQARFCESVESGHSNHSDSEKISEILEITTPPIRMDSQCKYATVARGDASIYLRLPTKKGYEEKIWDHASGFLLVEEAGGYVTDVEGKRLDFSIGRTLKENKGVIATNQKIHDPVLQAVKKVLSQKE